MRVDPTKYFKILKANPIAIRLLSQQLICQQFTSPADVVSHMGAIQAQDYRMFRWAVAMRMRRPSAEAFRKAFDGGDIVRLHLLRGTWQLVAGEDYRWMLALCGGKAEKTIRGWMNANRIVIDDRELHGIRDILVSTCEEKGSATKEDFAGALRSRGIVMDDHRLTYHIRLSELSGTLCSGRLSPMYATYALTEGRIPHSSLPERDEMLRRLAMKYFQSHSPATFEDYRWWSGLSAAECRRGMDALGTALRRERWQGYDFYLLDSCRTRGFRKGVSLLLPPFDEYLIGYKSRELVLAPEHTHRSHTNNGIFFPVIVHDGVVCGNWSPWQESLKTELFRPVDGTLSVERQWKDFCKLRNLQK